MRERGLTEPAVCQSRRGVDEHGDVLLGVRERDGHVDRGRQGALLKVRGHLGAAIRHDGAPPGRGGGCRRICTYTTPGVKTMDIYVFLDI